MKLGIVTPVLTLLPGAHARWEREGTLADVVRIARAADELGIDHLTCSEHVVIPEDIALVRGGRYWDPLATLGYLAAVTERVRLATSVLVLGYHHPLEIAKRYGTLDQVSGGRLILGVGVGSLEEEFELLGASFADRGERADDALRALRSSMSDPRPSYQGTTYRYRGVVLEPCALQDRVPIWVGGRTARSLRRAVELADGWCPFGISPAEAAGMIRRAAGTDAWAARDEPLEIVLQSERAFDPTGAAERTVGAVHELRQAGATALSLRLVHRSVDHYIEQMGAMSTLVASMASTTTQGNAHAR